MNKLIKTLMLAGLVTLSGLTNAATTSTEATMDITVLDNCTVGNATFDFTGAIGFDESTLKKTADVGVLCSNGTSYYVDTTANNYTVNINNVVGGFQPFTDAGYTNSMYYDGVTHSAVAQVGNSGTQPTTIYGRLTGNTTGTNWTAISGLVAGAISDTIPASIVVNW